MAKSIEVYPLLDRTPDRHPLPTLPHQGGGFRNTTFMQLRGINRRHRGRATTLRAVRAERACLASAVSADRFLGQSVKLVTGLVESLQTVSDRAARAVNNLSAHGQVLP